ncbi:MAG: hypothetical protein ABF320_05930 [Lentimonas sp.]
MKFGGKHLGAFVRTDRFKLYADGRFYNIANDLDEANNLAGSISGERAIGAHQKLTKLIKQFPPVSEWGGENSVRPIHPDWSLIK